MELGVQVIITEATVVVAGAGEAEIVEEVEKVEEDSATVEEVEEDTVTVEEVEEDTATVEAEIVEEVETVEVVEIVEVENK